MDLKKVFGIALLGGAGYVGYKMYSRKSSGGTTADGGTVTVTQDPSCLGDVYEDGAKLSQMVVDKLDPAIAATVNLAGGTDKSYDINMSDQAQSDAFEAALYVLDSQPNLNRDEMIRIIVSQFLAPHCDWSSPLPYAYDQPQSKVWRGAGLILDLATGNRALHQGA
jgi:hypothetical protein